MTQIENMCLDEAKQNLTPILSGNKGWGSLFSKENLDNLGTFLMKTSNKGYGEFMEARSNARITGKLLAHLLASKTSPLFGDQTFSLVGFSLGAQVCKSTVNRLMKLGKEKLIHNVYFMAGCTYIRSSKLHEQKSTFIASISGQIYNLHTKNDKALVFFETIFGHKSIGRNPHFQ